ncbi:MAG: hypothetical protein QGG67_19605 [Gammaproteobacteria bacterium]|jgi:hypothetical protein|nr:hypothetical protein [Gammaproteobacteria bacterium]MDP6098164.1 hypothetical protein [Gammaproteobacteria bacterium]MDP7456174.1 hypothetical protein [Gammaproteobacteria bacterium]|tara:strand:+ start:68 stop:670 length:603 start_codon:yes stop_codon:yes gene_type:complete
MNTPIHAVLNLTLLNSKNDASKVLCFQAVLLGALLPDLPMFYFFVVESLINGEPPSAVWGQLYFQPGWQNLFDTFNSIPFVLLGLGVAYYYCATFWLYLFLSMLLHILCDLPLHHDDGHHHFFPFSSWRFDSPVSYWDPRYYGRIFRVIEMIIAIGGSVILYRRASAKLMKSTFVAVAAIYSLVAVAWLISGRTMYSVIF